MDPWEWVEADTPAPFDFYTEPIPPRSLEAQNRIHQENLSLWLLTNPLYPSEGAGARYRQRVPLLYLLDTVPAGVLRQPNRPRTVLWIESSSMDRAEDLSHPSTRTSISIPSICDQRKPTDYCKLSPPPPMDRLYIYAYLEPSNLRLSYSTVVGPLGDTVPSVGYCPPLPLSLPRTLLLGCTTPPLNPQ